MAMPVIEIYLHSFWQEKGERNGCGGAISEIIKGVFMGSCIYKVTNPKIAWGAVTLHFPRGTTRRQRKHLMSKWIYESRKQSGLVLAYTGAIFQHGKAHHAHLSVFGVNERVGFDIWDINSTELEAIWGTITGLKYFKAAQVDKKEDFQSWQRYIFEKNTKESDDHESIFFNTRLLQAAGVA